MQPPRGPRPEGHPKRGIGGAGVKEAVLVYQKP
jgi:hypothetical protein